jgi:hypothetical protein
MAAKMVDLMALMMVVMMADMSAHQMVVMKGALMVD